MRTVHVQPERLERWLAGFVERNGETAYDGSSERLALSAANGTCAVLDVPFAPLTTEPYDGVEPFVTHALKVRRVGVVLVRRGGHAAGVFDGVELVASKVGSRHVQGRTAAGGWSQQRFARRREGQARVAYDAAADAVALVVLPVTETLDAVVLGGDRQALDAVMTDPRLASLLPLVVERRIDVPDPRRKVLEDTPRLFRAVTIRITDPIDES